MSRKFVATILLLVCMLAAMTVTKAELVELDPDNFEAVVNDPKKNVFVLFHASWCGHCKHMMPTWEELAAQHPSSGNVVIARIDANTHRDIAKPYGITGYPTILFFSKNDKKGLEFEGERKLEAFNDFIKKNAI